MLLKNIIKLKVDSAVEGMPTLDNFFTTKKPKRANKMKMKKSIYGVPVGLNSNGNSGDASGDGGGGE